MFENLGNIRTTIKEISARAKARGPAADDLEMLSKAMNIQEVFKYLSESSTQETIRNALEVFQKRVNAQVEALTGKPPPKVGKALKAVIAQPNLPAAGGTIVEAKPEPPVEVPQVTGGTLNVSNKTLGADLPLASGSSAKIESGTPGGPLEFKMAPDPLVQQKFNEEGKIETKIITVASPIKAETKVLIDETKAAKYEKPNWRCLKCETVISEDAADAAGFNCPACGHGAMKLLNSPPEEEQTPPEAPQDDVMSLLAQEIDPELEKLRPPVPPQDGEDTSTDFRTSDYTCDNVGSCGGDRLIMRIPDPKEKVEVFVTYRCLDCDHIGEFKLDEEHAAYTIKKSDIMDYEKFKKERVEKASEKSETKKKKGRPKKASKKSKKIKKAKEEIAVEPEQNELTNVEVTKEAKELLDASFLPPTPDVDSDTMYTEMLSMVSGWSLEQKVKQWEKLTTNTYGPQTDKDLMTQEIAQVLAGKVGVEV